MPAQGMVAPWKVPLLFIMVGAGMMRAGLPVPLSVVVVSIGFSMVPATVCWYYRCLRRP